MAALFVALSAIYLGACGPRLFWKGAAILTIVMVAVGLLATATVAHDAGKAGLLFRITLDSLMQGLAKQAIFAFGFYGLAALAGWAHRGLTCKPIGEEP
jgi:hypothetical protein